MRRLFRDLATPETALTALIAVLVVVFHVRFMLDAGGLWRDEAHTIAFATTEPFSALVNSLNTDSFPILSSLVFRAWAWTGWGATDAGLRAFGLAIGLAILGVMFVNARLMGRGSALVTIGLLGLSPLFIRVGDSIRPYGLGMLFVLLALGLIWRLTRRPGLGSFALAALGGVASVQTLYQNAFLILGICMGGIGVCLQRKRWSRAGLVLAVGVVSALSLLFYIDIIERSVVWRVVLYLPSDLRGLWSVWLEALGATGPSFLWVWLGAASLGAVVLFFRDSRGQRADEDLDLAFFCVSALVIGGVMFFAFLQRSEMHPQDRYFLPLIALAASCLGAIVGRRKEPAVFRILLILVAVSIGSKALWEDLGKRQTNIDLAASRLTELVAPEDLVVVQPWFYGPVFKRYYAGPAPWTTLPSLKEVRVIRYDLFKEKMTERDAIRPVLTSIASTLQAGNRVWFLQTLPKVRTDVPALLIVPAPHPDYGWSLHKLPFIRNWADRTAHLVALHSRETETIDPSPHVAVQPEERVWIQSATGWR